MRKRGGTIVAVHGNKFSKALEQERSQSYPDGMRECYYQFGLSAKTGEYVKDVRDVKR